MKRMNKNVTVKKSFKHDDIFTAKHKKVWLGMLVVAIIFVTILSGSTSPIYSQYAIQGDSAVFQTVGKFWAAGRVPYITLFDHKGPALYFIDAVGYYFSNSRFGIYFLQIIFMTVSCGTICHLLRTLLDEKKSLVFALCVVLSSAVCYSNGNMTEEYILPLISLSIMGLYRWTSHVQSIYSAKSSYKHNCKWTIVYGLTFGFALMTRLTNAIGVCIGVFVVTVFLILHGEWKNLFQNILCFLIGASLIILPFVVYFAYKGALYDMWYATFLFNLDYMEGSGLNLPSLCKVVYFVRGFMPVYGLLMVELLLFVLQKRIDFCSLLWTMVSAATLVYLVRSNGYEHYAMIGVPYIAVGILELYRAKKRGGEKKVLLHAVLILFVAVNVLNSVADAVWNVRGFLQSSANQNRYENTYGVLLEEIPEQERDSIAGYNVCNEFYLLYDIVPACRYFVLQESQSNYGEQAGAKIQNAFSESDAQWILLTRAEGGLLGIDDILDLEYINVDTVTAEGVNYQLYCRRNGT